MVKSFRTTDISGQMILLGTGTSVGVPAIGCGCDVCRSNNPKNKRTRSGAILGLPGGNLMIDTSPDMRGQLLREDIGIVHAVYYTHEHADHLHGMDDLRLFPFTLGHPVPLYCATQVEARIRRVFDYAFETIDGAHMGAIPQLTFHTIDREPVEVLGATLQPIPIQHGPRFRVLGFRIGNIAYCTDTNHIPSSSMELLQGLDYFIVGALRLEPHPSHFSVAEALEVIEKLKPKYAYLTHLSHDLEYEFTNAKLPPNVSLAYDGVRIPLT